MIETRTFHTQSEQETKLVAQQLARLLRAKDLVAMNGTLGAGKSVIARAMVRSLAPDVQDVPSPTFTIVQVYETNIGEVWHADLYRLHSIDETDELGLTDALDDCVCLIEWPDRLPGLDAMNPSRIDISMGPGEMDRIIRVTGPLVERMEDAA